MPHFLGWFADHDHPTTHNHHNAQPSHPNRDETRCGATGDRWVSCCSWSSSSWGCCCRAPRRSIQLGTPPPPPPVPSKVALDATPTPRPRSHPLPPRHGRAQLFHRTKKSRLPPHHAVHPPASRRRRRRRAHQTLAAPALARGRRWQRVWKEGGQGRRARRRQEERAAGTSPMPRQDRRRRRTHQPGRCSLLP